MGATGARRYLADQVIALLHGASPFVLLLTVVGFVVLRTERVSNTAAAALLVPIFLGVAATLGLPPVAMAAAIAIAASCAFMLPVTTPPNAIVFATGQVPQALMMRCGLALNLVCAVVIAVMMVGLNWA
ncbi:MAG: anion permease [Burkholderiales bacterium]|nr:anion permease [Burkholderiales bacterium]